MRNLFVLAIVVTLTGCATGPRTKAVRLESEPPGARVFIAYGVTEGKAVAETYLGQTPTVAEIPAEKDGTFVIRPHIAFASSFGTPPVAVVIARHGTNEVRRVFKKAAFAREGDLIPPAMFFEFPPP
jgi:hypothetical protein